MFHVERQKRPAPQGEILCGAGLLLIGERSPLGEERGNFIVYEILLERFSTKLRVSFGAKYGVYWMPICSQLLGTIA